MDIIEAPKMDEVFRTPMYGLRVDISPDSTQVQVTAEIRAGAQIRWTTLKMSPEDFARASLRLLRISKDLCAEDDLNKYFDEEIGRYVNEVDHD